MNPTPPKGASNGPQRGEGLRPSHPRFARHVALPGGAGAPPRPSAGSPPASLQESGGFAGLT